MQLLLDAERDDKLKNIMVQGEKKENHGKNDLSFRKITV